MHAQATGDNYATAVATASTETYNMHTLSDDKAGVERTSAPAGRWKERNQRRAEARQSECLLELPPSRQEASKTFAEAAVQTSVTLPSRQPCLWQCRLVEAASVVHDPVDENAEDDEGAEDIEMQYNNESADPRQPGLVMTPPSSGGADSAEAIPAPGQRSLLAHAQMRSLQRSKALDVDSVGAEDHTNEKLLEEMIGTVEHLDNMKMLEDMMGAIKLDDSDKGDPNHGLVDSSSDSEFGEVFPDCPDSSRRERQRELETPLKCKVQPGAIECQESPSKKLREMPDTPEDADAMIDCETGLFDFESLDEIGNIDTDDEGTTRSEEKLRACQHVHVRRIARRIDFGNDLQGSEASLAKVWLNWSQCMSQAMMRCTHQMAGVPMPTAPRMCDDDDVTGMKIDRVAKRPRDRDILAAPRARDTKKMAVPRRAGGRRLRMARGITVDSGAADNVLPRRMVRGKHNKVRPSAASRAGVHYVTASANRIPNEGETDLKFFTSEGKDLNWLFQVAEVNKVLASVSYLVDGNHRVVFDKDERTGQDLSCIINKATGEEVKMRRDNNVWVIDAYVDEDEDELFVRPE